MLKQSLDIISKIIFQTMQTKVIIDIIIGKIICNSFVWIQYVENNPIATSSHYCQVDGCRFPN